MTGGEPSQWARELLQEIEEDPFDVSSMEIDRMLEAWEVKEVLRGDPMLGYRTRAHPAAPQFVFHYPVRGELSVGAVRSICRAVHELQRRLAHDR